jgi:hypothetical protein
VDEKCPSFHKFLAPKASGLSRRSFYGLLFGGDTRHRRGEFGEKRIWKKDFTSSQRRVSIQRSEQPQEVKPIAEAPSLNEKVFSPEIVELIKNANRDKDKLRAERNERMKMTMDHIRIHFWDFVWGMLFIYTGTTLLAFYGACVMSVRRWLHKNAVISPISRREGSVKLAGTGTTDAAKLCADICLESTVAIYYKDINEEHGRKIGRFEINDLPIMILKPNETVYIHIYICTYIYIYIFFYICLYIYSYVYIYIYVNIYICECIYIYKYIYLPMMILKPNETVASLYIYICILYNIYVLIHT